MVHDEDVSFFVKYRERHLFCQAQVQLAISLEIELNKSKCFSVQLEISLNFEIKNKILNKILVNFLTISGSFKDFSGFFTKKWGGVPIFFWLES